MAISLNTTPGYITALSLGGKDYAVIAYREEADGTKTYLPANLDQQEHEKLRSLAWALFNTHDLKRKALNEPLFDGKFADARGLTKSDNSIVSHDFAISPLSQPIADSMAPFTQVQADTVKTQDVWNSIERIFRNVAPIQAPPAQPAAPTPATPPPSQPAPIVPPAPQPAPVLSLELPPLPTSLELDLHGHDFTQDDWFEKINVRQRLRIIDEIINARCPGRGIYEKAWKYFEKKATEAQMPNVSNYLYAERRKLIPLGQAIPSNIEISIRNEAQGIIDQYRTYLRDQSHLHARINILITKDFNCKDELYFRLYQQAIAEGVVIESWDQEWAKHHYLDNTERFIQALTGWLDNN